MVSFSFLTHLLVGIAVRCVTTRPFFTSESRLLAQEDIRGPLSDLQQLVLPDIQDQIQDYRYSKVLKVLHWESGSGPFWR